MYLLSYNVYNLIAIMFILFNNGNKIKKKNNLYNNIILTNNYTINVDKM
jgi:hypothetical protein